MVCRYCEKSTIVLGPPTTRITAGKQHANIFTHLLPPDRCDVFLARRHTHMPNGFSGKQHSMLRHGVFVCCILYTVVCTSSITTTKKHTLFAINWWLHIIDYRQIHELTAHTKKIVLSSNKCFNE